MGLRTTGMEFATEMVVKATLLRMNVSGSASPRFLPTDEAARPACAPGATAGGPYASSCCTVRAGCFFILA